jgi:hypothetical protein
MEVNDLIYVAVSLLRVKPFYCQFGRRENGFQTVLDAVKKSNSIDPAGN